jgi:hypothetical protein
VVVVVALHSQVLLDLVWLEVLGVVVEHVTVALVVLVVLETHHQQTHHREMLVVPEMLILSLVVD